MLKNINSAKALVAALVNAQTSTAAVARVWAASHYSLVPGFARDLNTAIDEARKAGAFSAPVSKGIVLVQARLGRKAGAEFDIWKQVRTSLNWAKCALFFEKGASPLGLPLMTEAAARKAWSLDFGRVEFPVEVLPLIAKGFAPTFEPKTKSPSTVANDMTIVVRKYYPAFYRNVVAAVLIHRTDGVWVPTEAKVWGAGTLSAAQDAAKNLLEGVPADMLVSFVGTRLWAEEAAKRANRPLVWLGEGFEDLLEKIFRGMDETIDDPSDDGSDDWVDPEIAATLESVEADYDAPTAEEIAYAIAHGEI